MGGNGLQGFVGRRGLDIMELHVGAGRNGSVMTRSANKV
jgi:hypothetical protein